MASIIVFFKSHLLRLNLFDSGSENVQTLQKERRSTRLYLLVLILSITILTFYYAITPFNQTIIIKSPSFAEYSMVIHQTALQCPCSKVSVKYEQFLRIKPVYHELCQSDFITHEWTNQLALLYDQSRGNSNLSDWRRIALFQFQTLRSLCELTQGTIASGLQTFQQRELVQTQLVSEELFHAQMTSFITVFIDSSSKMFLRTLQFIQNTTAQSLLMAGASMTSVIPNEQLGFNFDGVSIPFPGNIYTFSDESTCTCSSSTATTCMGTATLAGEPVYGFQTGCYMMNALLKSSLQILYNQSFVDTLTNSPEKFRKLSLAVPDTNVDSLLSRMLVTAWPNTISYEQYFNECKPDSCQYTVSHRYGLFHIVTLMIGLFGGLSASLRVAAPAVMEIVDLAIHKLNCRQPRNRNQVGIPQNPGKNLLLFC